MSITPVSIFIRASDNIILFEANFNELNPELHTLSILDVHSSELSNLWDQVRSSYERSLNFLENSEEVEPGDLDVIASKYHVTYLSYIKCLGNINEKLNAIRITMNESNSPGNNSNNSGQENHNLVLPPCDIDTFMGDYITWPAFRDLFTVLYIQSSRLSNIERMCHLIRHTDGEARDIVSKCPLSNEGFEVAWCNLRETYENPRMLVNNQLKLLFNLPSFDKESSVALKSLQRGINGFLSAMTMYKIPTIGWDPIIVFICIQRLPSATVSLWEQSIKDKSTLSMWRDLNLFLTERIQTLDYLNDIKGDNFQNICNEETTSSNIITCILCPNIRHFLRNCQRFKSLSVPDRISVISKYNYCINCLSKTHHVSNCRSSNNCIVCNDRHHSMLHSSPFNMTTAGQNSAEVFRPRVCG